MGLGIAANGIESVSSCGEPTLLNRCAKFDLEE